MKKLSFILSLLMSISAQAFDTKSSLLNLPDGTTLTPSSMIFLDPVIGYNMVDTWSAALRKHVAFSAVDQWLEKKQHRYPRFGDSYCQVKPASNRGAYLKAKTKYAVTQISNAYDIGGVSSTSLVIAEVNPDGKISSEPTGYFICFQYDHKETSYQGELGDYYNEYARGRQMKFSEFAWIVKDDFTITVPN